MPGPIIFRVGAGQGRIGWLRLLVVISIVAGLLFFVAVLAFGLLIVLAPLILLGAIVSYFFPGLRGRRKHNARPDIGNTIDAEYRIIEPSNNDGTSKRDEPPRIA